MINQRMIKIDLEFVETNARMCVMFPSNNSLFPLLLNFPYEIHGKIEIPILKPLVGIFEIRFQMIKWELYTEKFANILRINLLRFKSY